jgi:hypothetical protein
MSYAGTSGAGSRAELCCASPRLPAAHLTSSLQSQPRCHRPLSRDGSFVVTDVLSSGSRIAVSTPKRARTLRDSASSACARPSRPPHRPETGSEASSQTPPSTSPHPHPLSLKPNLTPPSVCFLQRSAWGAARALARAAADCGGESGRSSSRASSLTVSGRIRGREGHR